MTDKTMDDVVAAIQDLTRVTIALHGEFASKSEAIRKLHELSIPAGRIAAILAMKSADVSSAIAKYNKKKQPKEPSLTPAGPGGNGAVAETTGSGDSDG